MAIESHARAALVDSAASARTDEHDVEVGPGRRTGAEWRR